MTEEDTTRPTGKAAKAQARAEREEVERAETASRVEALRTAPVSLPPAIPVPALPEGTPVVVTAGPWAGLKGAVYRLTASVGGGRTTIVDIAPPAAGKKDGQFVPRSRLVVVENQHIQRA